MTTNERMGWKSRLTIGGAAVEFVSCDIKETRDLVEDDGLRGSRTRQMERVAQGQIHIGGSITMQPTPSEMAVVLPLVMGAGSLITDVMSDTTVVLDTGTQASTYTGRFSKMTMSGQPGKKVTVKLDFVGKSSSFGAGGTSGTLDIANRPYMFSDSGGITINGGVYSIDKFEFVIDNKIEPTYMQGQYPTDIEPTDRICTLGIQTRYTTEQALLTLAQAGPVIGSPLVGSIGFTNGSNSMSFTWGAMVAKSETVTVPGRQHLRLPLNYNLYGVGTSTKEIAAVLA